MPPITVTTSGTACQSRDQADLAVLFDAMDCPRTRVAVASEIHARRVTLPEPWMIASLHGSTPPSGSAARRAV